MKKIIYQLMFALPVAGLLFSGCEKTINADIPELDPVHSASCLFRPDTIWNVQVGKSAHILDDAGPQMVSGATVEIWSGDTLVEILTESFQQGRYTGLTSPVQDKSYSLRVSSPGLPQLTASAYIPEVVPLTSITVRDSAIITVDGIVQDEIRIRFQDAPGVDNYYSLALVYPDTIDYLGDTLIFWNAIYYSTLDPSLSSSFSGEGLPFTDVLFEGNEKEIILSIDNYYSAWGDKVFIILAHLSEDYYKYAVTYTAMQNTNGSPFSEPVQLHSNTQGGYGIFAGFSTSIAPVW